jgi:hypothetical protein
MPCACAASDSDRRNAGVRRVKSAVGLRERVPFGTLSSLVRYRIVLAIVALLALEASGLASLLIPPACAETCEDDREGACSPVCACCTCCFHPRSYARTDGPRAPRVPEVGRITMLESPHGTKAPPAGEIFHVPKRG